MRRAWSLVSLHFSPVFINTQQQPQQQQYTIMSVRTTRPLVIRHALGLCAVTCLTVKHFARADVVAVVVVYVRRCQGIVLLRVKCF